MFRSAVDTWAIGQVFPIVPLQRLNERPDMHAVLVDLTCDSDGKIDAFINPTGGPPLTALPLHSPGSNSKRPYRLAMFLAGVYQETMGSMHNLFGTLNSATVRLRKGAPAVRQRSFSEAGDTGGSVSVLSEVNHSMQSMPSAPSSQSLSSDGAYSDCGGGFGEHSDASASVVVVPEYAKKPGGGMFGGTQVESVEFKVERVTVGESAACVLTRAGHDPRAILTR